MSNKNKCDKKHLTLSQRAIIEIGLTKGESFLSISRKTGKDPTSISKEVRRHITYQVRSEFGRDIPCANRRHCFVRNLCDEPDCINLCNTCARPKFYCTTVCKDYEPKLCDRMKRAPFVCNGCSKKHSCLLKRGYYFAKHADDCYRDLLISCREGINQTPVDVAMLDSIISPLLKKGQSLAHIYANHAHEIPCCRKTLYNYIDKSLFTARNIDMRRRVRYKLRKRPTRISIAAREYRNGRTYDDFSKFIKEHPDASVVEMDTVIGMKGDYRTFLTMFFRNCSLMLIFLLDEKTSECVTKIFDWLNENLGIEVFRELFQVILTDNGVEFQRPLRLEGDSNGELRTKLFY